MKRTLFVLAPLLLCGVSYGAPCVTASLADYLALAPVGCTVGAATFDTFNLLPIPGFATPIPEAGITVTPVTSGSFTGLQFAPGVTSAAGAFFDVSVGFNVSGLIGGAALQLTGSTVTGDGSNTLLTTLDPIGVSLAAFDAALGGAQLTDSASFAAVSSLNVSIDLGLDGGLAGSAALQSASVTFNNVPEPATYTLLASGIAALFVGRRALRRRLSA